MRNVSDRICSENQTHILCSIIFSKNCAVYEIMWKRFVQLGSHGWPCGTCALHAGYRTL